MHMCMYMHTHTHTHTIHIHTHTHIYVYIHYYTPLPLNLANKQASKQATSTSPFCFGLCSISSLRALLYSSQRIAEVVALPNPSFEPKTHRWRPGAWAPSREVPSQKCAFCAPKQLFFLPKTAPKTHSKRPSEGKQLPHSTCALVAPVTKHPLLPTNSAMCLRNGPKLAKNGLDCEPFVSSSPKPRVGYMLVYVAQNQISRAPSPPATPHFLWFPTLNPTTPLVPRTNGHLVEPEGSRARARWGPTEGPNKGPKLFLDNLRC